MILTIQTSSCIKSALNQSGNRRGGHVPLAMPVSQDGAPVEGLAVVGGSPRATQSPA